MFLFQMKFYSAIKKMKALFSTGIEMELELVRFNKINGLTKKTYLIFSVICKEPGT